MAKGWPVVFLGQQFISILDAKMVGQRIVIVLVNQLRLNGFGYK